MSSASSNGARKHLYLDLQPYTCFYPNCSFSSMPFADRQLWSNHLELDHHFGPNWESVQCPLCLEATEAGKSKILIHFARHMEDIALAALPREVESDAESNAGSDDDSNLSSARDEAPSPSHDDKVVSYCAISICCTVTDDSADFHATRISGSQSSRFPLSGSRNCTGSLFQSPHIARAKSTKRSSCGPDGSDFGFDHRQRPAHNRA